MTQKKKKDARTKIFLTAFSKRSVRGKTTHDKEDVQCNQQVYTAALQLHKLYVHNYRKKGEEGITGGFRPEIRPHVPKRQRWGVH